MFELINSVPPIAYVIVLGSVLTAGVQAFIEAVR